ncbi:hypothetical protein EJ03DRAFT_329433 [Teratosphaeria nubilosa]|uniref:RING-type domain-containing protein n=1 Tax=Teratosphaeria nubilosa TaxID=161662 RepID=A0A6G1L2R0_9PEZI|nr:hypothetical protein EJ03DRAFT_329433 [Teratosphaeria nubilosa]
MSRSTSWVFTRRGSTQAHSRPRHASSASMSHLDVPSPEPEVHRTVSARRSNASLRGMRRLEARRQMEENNFLSSRARQSTFNPPLDFRLLEYVTPYDENLMCPICRCPFVEPIILAECDHCFCRDCIRQTWSSTYSPLGPRGDCPACRTPAKLGPRSATSKILCNILDELKVRCPKSEDGCTAEVKRGQVQDHVNLYCGYAWIECPEGHCDLPVRRKDALAGCLHYGVSCTDCHQSMQKANLETHWKSQCPDRRVNCERCTEDVFFRDFEMHSKETCPAITVPCAGQALGCTVRRKPGQATAHARSCTFAKLAPIIESQQQRLNEQENAQRTMSRKLEILENGLSALQQIMYPQQEDPDASSADERSIPFLDASSRTPSPASVIGSINAQAAFEASDPASRARHSSDTSAFRQSATFQRGRRAPAPPGPRATDLPASLTSDFDVASPFPPPATNGGPFASPLHHLLSMHESLRDEMGRISSALQELDGRQSMHTLNENLRTREEITYLNAQLAGLSRQVHWLTASQLQRQQSRVGTPGPSSSADADGVEAAVNAVSHATSALSGIARAVGGSGPGEQQGRRRGHSEEGRTKL